MNLCFITSNIRFDNPSDGLHSWTYRKDLLAQTLLKHSPDIIATQEGRYDQLKELESLLTGFVLIDQHRSWIKERMYPSFFIRKNTFEICQSGDAWLSETPTIAGSSSFESAFPRLMTWLHVQVKGTQQKFFIVNTHLDHIKESTRLCQIHVLNQEIDHLWDKLSYLVVMGDFNDSPDSDARKILDQKFQLKDAWKYFHSFEESSHHAFKGEVQNGTRIDWIMLDSRIKIEKSVMDKSNEQGKYPSDHFPVMCEIKF